MKKAPPTDLDGTLAGIARTAARLTESSGALLFVRDGDRLRVAGPRGPVTGAQESLPISRKTIVGRAFVDRRTVQLRDVGGSVARESGRGDGRRQARVPARASRFEDHTFLRQGRTVLAAPLLAAGEPVGVLVMRRAQVKPFTAQQVALVKMLADQAAIAIDGARLQEVLRARDGELGHALERGREALEQQTATGEILRVISSSQMDVQPVFDTIVRNAVRLCHAAYGGVYRLESGFIHSAAHDGFTPEQLEDWRRLFPTSVDGASPIARAIRTRDVVRISDPENNPDLTPEMRMNLRARGVRGGLFVPMLRHGEPIGGISVARRAADDFSETHVELLKTFADQAVIAIENARLLNELQARNADLTEALEQQTATAEILRVISSSPTDLQPVMDAVAANAARVCGAVDALIYRIDGDRLLRVAHFGALPSNVREVPIGRDTPFGRAVVERRTIHVDDLGPLLDSEYPAMRMTAAVSTGTRLAAPLMREGVPIGVILIRRSVVQPFTDKEIALLQTFADQAVIAIENVRLFTELQARNRDLTEALDRQTATAEILRVISRAQADVQPVFESIADSAIRLLGTWGAVVFQHQDGLMRLVAARGAAPGSGVYMDALRTPHPPSDEYPPGRAVLTGAVQHVADADTDPGWGPRLRQEARVRGFRATVAVPMLRGTDVVGAIGVSRQPSGGFTPSEIGLLQTFADQAVIAIENARLLNELQAKNTELTEALEQQTATSEILRAIAGSPTDVQPILDTIVENAGRVCDCEDVALLLTDGADAFLRASRGRVGFPAGLRVPITRDTVSGRAIVDGRPIHVHDLLTDEDFPEGRQLAEQFGHRTTLAVPLLREGRAFGAILVRRTAVRPFSDKHIDLLQTFADQAVIAIQNVRLFTELEARNSELRVALEQQTATSELLKVIGRSSFDLQPVFETLAENAVRLCEAERAFVHRFDGQALRVVATHNVSPELREFVEQRPIGPGRHSVAARAALGRCTVHIPDVQADPEFTYGAQQVEPVRTALAVSMLRADELLGVIMIYRHEVRPFTDGQVALLQTFADQAAIAIENARLLNQLQEKNADLTEALEQQTATGEILRVIAGSPTDLQPVLDTVAESSARLCDSHDAQILLFDGDQLTRVASYGTMVPVFSGYRPTRGSVSARAVIDRTVVHVHDLAADVDTEYPDARAAQSEQGTRTCLAVPMMREGTPIGVITIRRLEVRPFSEKQVALLQTFADQAIIAIENVRLFKELETRNSELRVTLEQQTATSDILKVISQSQTDVQPVFEAIADSALRLCEAKQGNVFLFEGELIHLAAVVGTDPDAADVVRRSFPQRPGQASASARAIATRRAVVIPDVRDDAEYQLAEVIRLAGYRSVMSVPMLRAGEPIGAITVTRAEPGSFPDKQLALLQTFADQAVIAIENARLFGELEARTRELTRSVTELRALGEVSQALSSTLDLDALLNTIVARANQLAGTDTCNVYEYDERAGEFHLRATNNVDEGMVTAARRAPIRRGEGVAGRLALTREPIQVSDIAEPGAYEGPLRDVLLARGTRALLGVPLLREDHLIGGLTVSRKTPGAFDPAVVELLKTFGNQSALAIQNARLFREIEEKSRQLEVADRHKSEFLANMSHELRTPLNAIIGYSEMLQEDAADLGGEQFIDDLRKIHAAGTHLLDLINAVLDLSKIEAGKMELYLETFDVAQMVHDIAAVIRPLAEKNGNQLDVRCEPDVGRMHADLTKVRQALFNLLSNACKFTERGTVAITVAREGADGDGWLRFTVADSGIGMTPEQVSRLFQDFTQADPSTGRKYGGTGLGLALSRRLCRMMGGDIAVDSESGRGSAFTVRLPAVVVDPQVEGADGSHAEPGDGSAARAKGGESRAAAPQPAGAAAAGTVLVVDDDAAIRELMQRFLVREGFRVITAAGGADGLRLARDLQPDVITLDVMMPGIDGWAVLTALKGDVQTRDIPVVMLTIVDDRNLGYALGADDYVIKPIDRDRLLAVLARFARAAHVLVVDDDPDVRALLRRTLEKSGYRVAEAAHGRAALAWLADARPDLILLDLMMPEMDGFELLEELRRTGGARDVPIVVVTAKDLTPDDHRRLNGSVERILQKGALEREALLAEVRQRVANSVSRRKVRDGWPAS